MVIRIKADLSSPHSYAISMCYEHSNSFLLAILKSIIIAILILLCYRTWEIITPIQLHLIPAIYCFSISFLLCWLQALISIILFFLYFEISLQFPNTFLCFCNWFTVLPKLLQMTEFLFLLLKNILICICFIHSSNINWFHILGIVNSAAMETQVSFEHTNLIALWLYSMVGLPADTAVLFLRK